MALKSLEEQIEKLGNIPARVVILDDEPKELRWILTRLNVKGQQDNLGFVGTTSPDEAYDVLTKDTSLVAVVGDVYFNALSSQELARFPNGQEFIKKASDARPDIFTALMSVDKLVSGMLKDLPYVNDVWEGKDSSTIDELYSNIKSGIPPPPKYNRLICIAGASGAGKSSILKRVKLRTPYASVVVPATTRPHTRPNDSVNQNLLPIYQHLMDEFVTLEGMDEIVNKSKSPFLWTTDGRITDKSGYFKLRKEGLPKGIHFYAFDEEKIRYALKKGHVFAPVRTVEMMGEIRRRFEEESYFIVLHTDKTVRDRRMRQEGRTPEEIKLRSRIETGVENGRLRRADAIIDTRLDIHEIDPKSSPKFYRERSIDHIFTKVSTTTNRLGETPHGVSAPKINASYVCDVERDFCAAFGYKGNSLNVGPIKIPNKSVTGYHNLRKKAGEDESVLGLIEMVSHSPSQIVQITAIKGIKSVRIVPELMINLVPDANDAENFGHVLKRHFEYHLESSGFKFKPAETDKIYPHSHSHQLLSNKLVYALSDHKISGGIYRLELIFG